MKAYLHPDWCGLGDRLIVHPRGLPPSWKESNLSEEVQRAALKAADEIYARQNEVTDPNILYVLRRQSPDCRKFTIHRHGFVLHLNPTTLELIEALPII